MPKLTLNALNNDLSVQDPFPAGGLLTATAKVGTPKELDVTWDQLKRIRPQLTAEETAGNLSWTAEVTGLDTRAEEHDLIGLPVIDLLNTATKAPSAGGAVTDATIDGANLGAGQIKASKVIGPALTANDFITYDAIVPGAEGNLITVEHKTGSGLVVGVVGSVITVTLDAGTSDYDAVATAVNAHADAKLLVKATRGGTGAGIVVVEDPIALEDGVGSGVSLTIGGLAAVLTEVKDDGTQITYNIDATSLTQADTAILELRSGDKINRIAVVVAA